MSIYKNIFCPHTSMKPEYDSRYKYGTSERTMNRTENVFSYQVKIYFDSKRELDSSEHGSEIKFDFILANFSPSPSTCCHPWELGSWINAVLLGEMDEEDPSVGLSSDSTSPALPTTWDCTPSLSSWEVGRMGRTPGVTLAGPVMCYFDF